MKSVYLLLFFLSILSLTYAQSKKKTVQPKPIVSGLKIGYIFEDYILDNYDEIKNINLAIENRQKAMQDQYNQLAIEYQNKLLAYQNSLKNIDSLTTETLNANLKAVQDIKAAADELEKNSELEIRQMSKEAIQLVNERIREATKQVAKEKGYPYVWTRNQSESLLNGTKVVLYYDDKGQHNLSDAVLIKLGNTTPVDK